MSGWGDQPPITSSTTSAAPVTSGWGGPPPPQPIIAGKSQIESPHQGKGKRKSNSKFIMDSYRTRKRWLYNKSHYAISMRARVKLRKEIVNAFVQIFLKSKA